MMLTSELQPGPNGIGIGGENEGMVRGNSSKQIYKTNADGSITVDKWDISFNSRNH